MDKRTLEILISMGMKPDTVNKTIAEFKKINAQFEVLEKDAKNLKGAIEISLAHGEDASELKSQLKVVEDAMSRLQSQMDKTNKSAKDLKENAYYLRDVGEKLNQIGMGMQNAGNALLSPLKGAMAAYMEQQTAIKEAGGQMSDSAKKYVDAQKQMQDAYVRIGAIAADKLLPVMETAADLVDKLADFIEQNPQLITVIAGLGIGLSGLGKAASIAGQFSMAAGTLQGLGAGGATAAGSVGGGALAGGAAATAGSAALLIAAPILGANIAKWVGNAFQRSMGQEESSWGDIGKTAQQLAVVASPLNLLATGAEKLGIISTETHAKIFDFQKNIVGLGDAAEEAAPKVEKSAEEIIAALEAEAKATEEAAKAAEKRAQAEKQLAEAYENFKVQETEAARDYANNRRKIAEDSDRAALEAKRTHEQSIAKIEADYVSQRADLLNDYKTQDAQAASQYKTERAQTIRDGGEEIRQIEKDHQKQLAELLEGHNERMTDLVANRDALGIAQEMRDYEKSRRKEEDGSNEEIAQRRADIAQRLQDMAQAYAAERAQRQQALQQSLIETAAQRKTQLAEERQQFAESERKRKEEASRQLRDLAMQYQEEARRRREAYLRSIRDLDTALNGESSRKRQYYALMLRDAEAFMQKWRAQMYASTPVTGKRAGGGYVTDGIYRMGEVGKEYVANAQTTRALEGMAGGSLTQDRLLSLAARGGARSSSAINLHQEITFNGEDNATSRAQLRMLMHDVAVDAMKQVFPN